MNPKNIFRFLILFIFLPILSCRNKKEPGANAGKPNYQLVWSDEFDYTGLPDSTKWSFDTEGNAWGWGNNEAQFYTKDRIENAEVKNGNLYITAIKEDFQEKSYTSVRLITKGKGDWLYGKFEIKAKLPDGRGLWPAIWMLPTDWNYGGWPASGEIDIMENVGYMPDTILGTVHMQSDPHSIHTQKSDSIVLPDCYDRFHVYQLEWDPEEIRMFVDSVHYFTLKKEESTSREWPFDKQFHLLLNVAVGGSWGGLHGIDDSIFSRSMIVDYVRVYQNE